MRLGIVLAAAAFVHGQSAQIPQTPAEPRFEAASIKINTSGSGGSMSNSTKSGRFSVTNMSALTLIVNAYDLREYLVLNAPSWTRTERYDVNAVGSGQTTEPRDRMAAMMRNMLADRFKLATHTERRDLPIYELVLARSDGRLGDKLKPVNSDATIGGGTGGSRMIGGGAASFRMQRAELSLLAGQLGSIVGRPVIDRTELTGRFNVELSWAPEQAGAGGAPADSNAPSIFTAVQEQLGLRLRSARGPVEVLVIDRIEHPTPD